MSSIAVCGLYYYAWMKLIPQWRGYRIRTEILEVDENGANTNRLVKVPLADVAAWDAVHDEAGNLRRRHPGDSDGASSPVEQIIEGSKA